MRAIERSYTPLPAALPSPFRARLTMRSFVPQIGTDKTKEKKKI